jgi:hypothetical protein
VSELLGVTLAVRVGDGVMLIVGVMERYNGNTRSAVVAGWMKSVRSWYSKWAALLVAGKLNPVESPVNTNTSYTPWVCGPVTQVMEVLDAAKTVHIAPPTVTLGAEALEWSNVRPRPETTISAPPYPGPRFGATDSTKGEFWREYSSWPGNLKITPPCCTVNVLTCTEYVMDGAVKLAI